jgi:hypothetical protein
MPGFHQAIRSNRSQKLLGNLLRPFLLLIPYTGNFVEIEIIAHFPDLRPLLPLPEYPIRIGHITQLRNTVYKGFAGVPSPFVENSSGNFGLGDYIT